MSIVKLPPQHWHQLEEIFADEFNSDLPEHRNAEIFMVTENGQRKGFILAEDIKMVGQIYVYPEFRGKDIVKTARSLVKFTQERFKGVVPVGTIASEPRFARLYKHLGMEKINGDFYRINT